MVTSVYAGSFDPITKGHEWVVANAPGPVMVVVASDPRKTYRFSAERRTDLVRWSLPNVEICRLDSGYLVDLAWQLGARYIVRGVRSAADYEAERQYALACRAINPKGPQHLLLVPPPELEIVSSTTVKALVGPTGWESVVSRLVSPHVLEALRS